MSEFIRMAPPQLQRALTQLKQELEVTRGLLEATQKDRDDLAARVAELATVIANGEDTNRARDAIPPPPPSVEPNALDIIAFEADVKETLEFYAKGGQDFGNRAAKVLSDARRRAEVAATEPEAP